VSLVAAAGQLLTYALAGMYVLVTGILYITWATAYEDPGKHPRDLLTIPFWPVLMTVRLVRWSFTGRWTRE
jgi:hypothetical protein